MSHPWFNSTAIALVTCGSRWLGSNTALHLARKSSDVVITYRSQQAEADGVVAQIAALGRRAVTLPLDVAQLSIFSAFS